MIPITIILWTLHEEFKKYDEFNSFTDKSKNISYRGNKAIGPSENKMVKELDFEGKLGGQNDTVDMNHPIYGPLQFKENDSRLGVLGKESLNELFSLTVYLFKNWLYKYKSTCNVAKELSNNLNKKHGQAKVTVLEGISRGEICEHNLLELNNSLELLKKEKKKDFENKNESLQSEYVIDIIKYMGEKCLQDYLNDIVRQEALNMQLIIVHEQYGWLAVKDLNKLTCSRITMNTPKIIYDHPLLKKK